MTATIPTTLPELAPADTWPLLRELDLTVSQQIFHVLMEGFSRPGTLATLPDGVVPAPVPAALAPLLALADIMTPISALPSGTAPSQEAVTAVARLTGAPLVEPTATRFALALGEPDALGQLNTGSHWSPEQGAMLVQRVGALTAVDPDAAAPGDWHLRGPGIPSDVDRVLRVVGLSESWRARRAVLTADYPAGIDCLLVTDGGVVAALPRTTEIEAH